MAEERKRRNHLSDEQRLQKLMAEADRIKKKMEEKKKKLESVDLKPISDNVGKIFLQLSEFDITAYSTEERAAFKNNGPKAKRLVKELARKIAAAYPEETQEPQEEAQETTQETPAE